MEHSTTLSELRMEMEHRIAISKDFSPYPMGRYRKHSKSSGEAFRDELLIPALKTGAVVVVNFAGAFGYPASFVEEAFGGLIRKGYTLDELERKLKLEEGERQFSVYTTQAWEFIKEAAERS